MPDPIIHVTSLGNLGNRMIQYLVARALQRRVPGSRVVGYDLGPWGLAAPPAGPLPSRTVTITDRHEINLDRIARALRAGIADAVDLQLFGQRMDYFEEPDIARALFMGNLGPRVGPGVPDDCLLVSIRGGEVLRGAHPDYRPLPLSFYADVIARTGLNPVFMGQLDDSSYGAALRQRFPAATFRHGVTPVADFNTIANSRNILCSISTFCWLAAWMSPVATAIHLPVAGLYHPVQRPDVDLLPLGDRRYQFWMAAPEKWSGSPEALAACATQTGWATPIGHADLAEVVRAQWA